MLRRSLFALLFAIYSLGAATGVLTVDRCRTEGATLWCQATLNTVNPDREIFYQVSTPLAGTTVQMRSDLMTKTIAAATAAGVTITAADIDIGVHRKLVKIDPVAPSQYSFIAGNKVWTNMPAAATECFGQQHRLKVDLSLADQIRFIVQVGTSGFAGANFFVQWSTDESVWNTVGGAIPVDTTGTKVSAWLNIPETMQQDLFVRCMGQAGNGTLDPAINIIAFQIR